MQEIVRPLSVLILFSFMPVFSAEELPLIVKHDTREVVQRIKGLPKDLQNVISEKVDLLYRKNGDGRFLNFGDSSTITHVNCDKKLSRLACIVQKKNTEKSSLWVYDFKSRKATVVGDFDGKIEKMYIDELGGSTVVQEEGREWQSFRCISEGDAVTNCLAPTDGARQPRSDFLPSLMTHHLETSTDRSKLFSVASPLYDESKKMILVYNSEGGPGKPICKIVEHPGAIKHASFNNNGRKILLQFEDAVFVLSLDKQERQLFHLISNRFSLSSSTLSPKGTKVATFDSAEKSVLVYDTNSADELCKIDDFEKETVVDFTRSGRVVTASTEGDIVIWDWEKEKGKEAVPYREKVLPLANVLSKNGFKVKQIAADGTSVLLTSEDDKSVYFIPFASYLKEILQEFEEEQGLHL